MSDSSGYGGFSAPGPQDPQGSAPSPYAPGASTGEGGYYGASDPYGASDSYGASGSYSSGEPYGSADPYGSGDSFGSADAYASSSPYGSGDPYAAGASAPEGGPFGSPEQAPRPGAEPSSQPSYPPAYQPSYQVSTAYPAGMYGATALRPTSGMAITGFVLGLVGVVVTCGLTAPIGIIFSFLGMQATGENGTHSGRGFAIAGLVLSIIGTAVLLLFVGLMVLGAVSGS
jgi:uncharacterized membrane protein